MRARAHKHTYTALRPSDSLSLGGDRGGLARHLDVCEPGLGRLEVALRGLEYCLDAFGHLAPSLQEASPLHLRQPKGGIDAQNLEQRNLICDAKTKETIQKTRKKAGDKGPMPREPLHPTHAYTAQQKGVNQVGRGRGGVGGGGLVMIFIPGM